MGLNLNWFKSYDIKCNRGGYYVIDDDICVSFLKSLCIFQPGPAGQIMPNPSLFTPPDFGLSTVLLDVLICS